jgi:hypothetical protein
MLTCVFVLVGAALLLAPARALATPGTGHAALGTRNAARAGVDFQRLGDTTYAISGHVLNYAGNPVAGAEVDWGWWSGIFDYHSANSNITEATPTGTGSSGAFAFAGITGGHQLGASRRMTFMSTTSLVSQGFKRWLPGLSTSRPKTTRRRTTTRCSPPR